MGGAWPGFHKCSVTVRGLEVERVIRGGPSSPQELMIGIPAETHRGAHLRRFEPTARAGVEQSVGAILPIGFSSHLLIGPPPTSTGVFGVYCILANTVTR